MSDELKCTQCNWSNAAVACSRPQAQQVDATCGDKCPQCGEGQVVPMFQTQQTSAGSPCITLTVNSANDMEWGDGSVFSTDRYVALATASLREQFPGVDVEVNYEYQSDQSGYVRVDGHNVRVDEGDLPDVCSMPDDEGWIATGEDA